MNDYPEMLTTTHQVAPVARRVRAVLAGETVVDTTRALYAWEWPYYPQFYVPVDDVAAGVLVPSGDMQAGPFGEVEVHDLRVRDAERPRAAKVLRSSSVDALAGTVRLEWDQLDAWYEEDEEVFVHPRNPYVRVDALRSTRSVRVELEGMRLAESSSPVMVFETGLPTRYYLNRTDVDFTHLEPSDTVTACPYKGTTSGYWSIRIGERTFPDLVWAYDFPTRQLLPIAGLVAFYNEKVDIFVDGVELGRPAAP